MEERYNKLLTLADFKAVCQPMQLWNIGRKSAAIHPSLDEISNTDVCRISQEVNLDVTHTLFGLNVLWLGMADVLFCFRVNLKKGGYSFNCFSTAESRSEIAAYYAEQMIQLRHELRFKPHYVDILIQSALKAPLTRAFVMGGMEETKKVVLFCGLSMHTLLMASDPQFVTKKKNEQDIIISAQLQWRLQHEECDLALFFRKNEYEEGRGSDAWDRGGPDCMERIGMLHNALAEASLNTAEDYFSMS